MPAACFAPACWMAACRWVTWMKETSKQSSRGKSSSTPSGICSPASAYFLSDSSGQVFPITSGSSPADSPARTSATQDFAQELTERAAGCGERWQDSFAFLDRTACLWRTSQLCFTGEWSVCSQTFPRAGTMRNGIVFQRQPLAPLTSVTEFSSWPTPIQKDSQSRSSNGTLLDSVRMFPTPRAIYGEHPGMQDPRHLTGAAKLWPTPTADDANNVTRQFGLFQSLTREVNKDPWPTPRVTANGGHGRHRGDNKSRLEDEVHNPKRFRSPSSRDWKGQSAESWRLRTSGDTTPTLPDQVGGQLNPTWVEWLMGYPLEWVNLPDLATPSSRKSRSSSAHASAKNSKSEK